MALPTRDQVRPLVMLLAAVGSFLLASFVSSQWMTLLQWWHQVPFGKVDPVLGHDAAMYVFTLPALELLRGVLHGVAAADRGRGSLALYFAAGQAALTPFGVRIDDRRAPTPRRAGDAALPGARARRVAGRLQEIVSPSGIIQGASYADAHARMPAALALMIAALVAAALAAATALGRSTRGVLVGAAVYVIVLFGGEGYASLLQRFAVTPNEQVRETPFMEYNIAATREAFALDRVEERELRGEATLTRKDIEANRGTLDNVRLWDHQPLLETFGQIQEIRTYYDFVSVDNDRYQINGQNRQVMLSVRELNPAALPNRTWVNERLVFTHGHGLTLGPVNQVTSEGLPVLFVRDLPPVTTVDLNITEPSIYFGELVNDYVIVAHARAGVPLSEGRRQRLHHLRRHRRRAARVVLAQAAVRRALPELPDHPERRHHHREPVDVRSADSTPRREDRAVPGARRGPLSGGERRPDLLDPGRLHGRRIAIPTRPRRAA